LASVTVYGIKNCDTMIEARTWLDEHRVKYDFHDYKVAGIERDRLEASCEKVGWEVLLNRSGTTKPGSASRTIGAICSFGFPEK
jgi:arsenate reductase (glutaredoxin)